MFEVIEGGIQTTVQDYPGRIGYWNIGIPPSGPMDPLAFRLANLLVGNFQGEAGLEITAVGPKLRFLEDAVVAVTGPKLRLEVDGELIPMWESVKVKRESILSIGLIKEYGFRAYLAIAGGIDVPIFLGSKSTMTPPRPPFLPYGHLGGFEGRPLKRGDVLKTSRPNKLLAELVGRKLKASAMPTYQRVWEIGAIPGPHADPDFLTPEDMKMFFNYDWKVHRNSNRLGYRLSGPKPRWARNDGGEAGRHPSNIHDCAYAIGTVNMTGDMPIILTVDGPSLGGFVSNATIVSAELWKVGQAVPGVDIMRFRKLTLEEAVKLRKEQEKLIATSISG
ncbi:MAG: 5-oxoprolinase/urea amidolyase family protein [Candidatus Bathyarchaeia archaeon]